MPTSLPVFPFCAPAQRVGAAAQLEMRFYLLDFLFFVATLPQHNNIEECRMLMVRGRGGALTPCLESIWLAGVASLWPAAQFLRKGCGGCTHKQIVLHNRSRGQTTRSSSGAKQGWGEASMHGNWPHMRATVSES